MNLGSMDSQTQGCFILLLDDTMYWTLSNFNIDILIYYSGVDQHILKSHCVLMKEDSGLGSNCF